MGGVQYDVNVDTARTDDEATLLKLVEAAANTPPSTYRQLLIGIPTKQANQLMSDPTVREKTIDRATTMYNLKPGTVKLVKLDSSKQDSDSDETDFKIIAESADSPTTESKPASTCKIM